MLVAPRCGGRPATPSGVPGSAFPRPAGPGASMIGRRQGGQRLSAEERHNKAGFVFLLPVAALRPTPPRFTRNAAAWDVSQHHRRPTRRAGTLIG